MNGTISPEAIRNLAYQLWEQRGRQGGSAEEDWFRAEEILRNGQRADAAGAALGQVSAASAAGEKQKATEKVDHAVEESFPASDPPAVHTKDEPPVNAGAKWKAAKAATRNGSPRRGGGAHA